MTTPTKPVQTLPNSPQMATSPAVGRQRRRRLYVPIAMKLIIVTVIILLAAVIPVALQASQLFRDVFGKREEDANRSQAEARAADIEQMLRGLQSKSAALGALILKEGASVDPGTATTAATDNVHFFFERERSLVSLRVYEKTSKSPRMVQRLVNHAYLQGYHLSADFLDELDQKVPLPLLASGDLGDDIVTRSRSLPGKLAILTMIQPLAKDSLGKVTHSVVADIDMAGLQKAFAQTGERTVYLVDENGAVLAHPDEKMLMSRTNLAKRASVRQALSSKMAQGQLRFSPKAGKGYVVSAFSRTSFGLAVISEASEEVILAPAKLVQREALYITGLVLSASFFIIFLFSLTLTRPIERLVQVTKEVAKGNFHIDPMAVVRSTDEVGTLAMALAHMIFGLKEREKVKSLFNKFHGSSVTESLLSGDSVALGGRKRQVAVLFSDIRSFTSYSEKKSPEDVVRMLNEYFHYMVAIIQKNHGVVDKFIGDAIMAIWGAPAGGPDDAKNAVKAALDMRLALQDLNKIRLARGEEAIKIGIGLHYGEAIAGTIGSDDRMEYTVIGNTVNTTARIEASTKAFGVDILLSQEIVAKVGQQFLVELVGKSAVKGRSEPLALFKVRGYLNAANVPVMVSTPYSDFEADAEGDDKVKVVS